MQGRGFWVAVIVNKGGVVKRLDGGIALVTLLPDQQSLAVKRRKQGSTFLQSTQALEAQGEHALEDIVVFPVQGRVAMLIIKALNLLEARDDAAIPKMALDHKSGH